MGALHRAGFASQPSSSSRDDGLVLYDAYISMAARCAPPANKPTPVELLNCRDWLVADLRLLTRAQVIVALGRIAFDAVLKAAPAIGARLPPRRPTFGHGAQARLEREHATPPQLIASYHPSRQNTNTGKLTVPMFDRIFAAARDALS
jgi:uracil-DNA glycosylase family 4